MRRRHFRSHRGSRSVGGVSPAPDLGVIWLSADGGSGLWGFTAPFRASSSTDAPPIVLDIADLPVGFDVDPARGIWLCTHRSGPEVLHHYPASQLASSGTPTPDISINTALSSVMAAALDRDDLTALWVLDRAPPTGVVRFSGSQLEESSVSDVIPDRIITLDVYEHLTEAPFVNFYFDNSGWCWLAQNFFAGATPADKVWGLSPAQLAVSGGAVVPEVELTGSNWGDNSGSGGPCGMALDPDGAHLWVAFFGESKVSKFLLSDMREGGNLAPVVTITGDDIVGPTGLVFEDADLWIATWSPGSLVKIAAADLTTSGAKTAAVVLTGDGLIAGAGWLVRSPRQAVPDPPPSGFLAAYWFDAGTPATTEITPDIETNVVSGVAPLPVFFDAKGTTGTGATLPYGELAYAWDFDDADGESWSYGAVEDGGEAFPKRLGLGPVEFHVYEAAGSYTAELQVRDPDKKMASDTVAITVTDPETVFATTNTVLISTGSDFTRDPGDYVGAAEVTTSTFAGIAAQCTAGKRVLLKRGDVWTDSGFLQVANVGPSHLGAWGDELDPLPELTGGGNIAVGDDNRDNPIAGSTGGLRFTDLFLNGVGIEWFGATQNTLFMRITMRNESAVCSGSVMNFFGHDIPDGVFFVDCDFQGVPTGSGNNIVFMAAKRQAYYGCRFSDSTEGEHCLRLSTAQRLVIAHCNLDGAPAGRHLLKLHAPTFDSQPNEGAGSPTPGVPNPFFPTGRYSEYANIHDNVFVNTEGCEWMVHPAPQNDAQNERGRSYIFERNLLQDPNGAAAVMLFMCDVQDSWVKACAFDRGTGTAMHLGLGQRDSSEPTLMGLHDCWLANNTHYGPSSTQAIINFRGPFGSGTSWENINEKNGLIVRGTVPTDAEFTSADNVITTTPELTTDPPVTAADYNIQSDSPARGAGTGEGAAFWDLFLRPLNWGNGTTVDVGAAQYEEP